MPAFVVKATLKDGDLLPPITAMAADEAAAVALVKACLTSHDIVKVEAKGLRSDVMKAAFGEQNDGTVAIRSDWIWSGDKPEPKK